MKNILKLTLLVIPFSLSMSISAQQYPGAGMEGQPDINKMMATMQKAQACIQKISKKKIEEMSKKTQVIQIKVQSLCAKGKRAQAAKTSLKYGKKMMNDPVVKAMKKCTDIMSGMANITTNDDVHACDMEYVSMPQGGMGMPLGY